MPNHDDPPNHDGPDRSARTPADQGAVLPRSIYNWLSLAGGLLALIGGTAAVCNLTLGLISGGGSGYGGLTLLPPLAATFFGVFLFAVGFVRESRRRARGMGASITGTWSIDTKRLKQDHVAAKLVVGTVVCSTAVLGIGAASMGSLHYTESNAFCGNMCHDVMHPEATAYDHSPHARVDCVECHVGEGTESFIRAKLTGLGQVISVVTGNIERPIPTPIGNRRPSREMCESCHWAERSIDYKIIRRTYHRIDEANTQRTVQMMVKVGGGGDGESDGSGIHYHMLIAQKVEFIARDPQRQKIAWVRVTGSDGSVTEYNHLDEPLSDEEKESLEVHTMECLDCHNRPAHQFRAPIDSVNRLLDTGKLSIDLPYIKREGVRALDGDYPNTDAAMKGIAESLGAFYAKNYPKLANTDASMLEENIATLQATYRRSVFPEMKAGWSAHPNNIGHRDSPGCFRCHNYEMESDDGDTIFVDCSPCHAILDQEDPSGSGGEFVELDFERGMAFLHPDGDEYMENQTLCSDCHDGGFRLYKKEEEGS